MRRVRAVGERDGNQKASCNRAVTKIPTGVGERTGGRWPGGFILSSPGRKHRAGVLLDGRWACKAELHVGVLELIVQTRGHPGLDLCHPQLTHAVHHVDVEHVQVVGLAIDRREGRLPFPHPRVPDFRRAACAVCGSVDNLTKTARSSSASHRDGFLITSDAVKQKRRAASQMQVALMAESGVRW